MNDVAWPPTAPPVVLLPLLHAAPPTQVCRGAVVGIVPAGGEIQALPRILLLLRCHLLSPLAQGLSEPEKGELL